jgi:hypothetical protein
MDFRELVSKKTSKKIDALVLNLDGPIHIDVKFPKYSLEGFIDVDKTGHLSVDFQNANRLGLFVQLCKREMPVWIELHKLIMNKIKYPFGV